MIIEGAIAVKSAISNQKRNIEELYILKDKKTKDFNYIRKIAKAKGIPIREMDEAAIKEVLTGKSHGGVGIKAGPRKNDSFKEGDIFFLDGIEDPFNLGYSLRTLYAFGFHNVLLSERNYENMEAQLLKSSAGAYDMLRVRVAADPVSEIRNHKENGYHIYGLFRGEGSRDIFAVQFKDKALLMLGGEKRGIRAELLDLCDEHLHIAYGSDFRNALNACAALDVTATLLFRQRKNG